MFFTLLAGDVRLPAWSVALNGAVEKDMVMRQGKSDVFGLGGNVDMVECFRGGRGGQELLDWAH